MAESHLGLKHLEVLRHARLGFAAHLLAGPLEGAVDFLGEIHRGGVQLVSWGERKKEVIVRGISVLGSFMLQRRYSAGGQTTILAYLYGVSSVWNVFVVP